ncbi:floral homeotic protein DEFICIENS-like [Carica papaya]|uniref:B-class MADS-box protein TM6-2 n=1 Tax=Carica papaya TaxID=3649 RepID=A5JSC6_CARPA|nr:floral homeotic protein DEFICIENS-like [Carica papaya]ABQ51322.1 B-class MADS-box protein TM6-2 [Carica papaya]
MGRGKIEIKRIENPTNRQVTYSKRRNGIFKKAQELTVLCDAKVSLIMISNTGKLHEFISPTATTKKMIDQYQSTLGVDLWSTHYQKMQDNLKKLREINNKLRREIRQRSGEDLHDASVEELRGLEQNMASALEVIRERKFHTIKTQTDTYKKKVRNLEEQNGNLLLKFETRYHGDPHYGLIENERDYESAIALANGASNLHAFRLHHNHHPNDLHLGGFGCSDLRLA